ncbi:MAG: hypothetical protein IK105_07995 [Thermoguttaceae bacterium]|nr:hypothetical protein [Thermoguttaceae bacterium]
MTDGDPSVKTETNSSSSDAQPRIQPLDESLLGESSSPMGRRSYFFFRSLLYGFLYFVLVMILLIILTLIGVGLWVKHCRKTISPHQAQKAHSVQLTGWLAFNDMQKQTPEVRNRLLRKYEYRLNLLQKSDINSPMVVKAIPYIQQAALEYLHKRDEKIIAQEIEARKTAIGRPDYRVVSGPDSGRYIATDEIQPTEELVERIKRRHDELRAEYDPLAYHESQIESNIRTLTKEFFLHQMVIYDNRPDNEKVACILETAAALNHFSELYDKARTELGLPPQGTVEQIRDLNHIVAGWIDTTTPEFLARLYWFKDVMVAVIVADRRGDPATVAEQMVSHADAAKKPGLLRGILGDVRAQKENGGAEKPAGEALSEDAASGEAPSAEETPAEEPEFF